VEVVRKLRINMPLLDALQVPTYSCYFKYILANKYEIATLGVDHVRCPSNAAPLLQMD
jgi:hypothetical protein